MTGFGATGGRVLAGFTATAGDSHARHEDLSFKFVTQQTEHVQESVGGLNFSPNPDGAAVGTVGFSATGAPS